MLFISCLNYSQTLLETVNLPAETFYNYGYGLVYENGKYWISSSSSSTGYGVIKAVNSSGNEVDQLNINYY